MHLMRGTKFLLAVYVIALAHGCGNAEEAADAGGTSGVAGTGATSSSGGSVGDAGLDVIGIQDSPAIPDAVSTDGWCAPDASTSLEKTACCNDQPCNGYCYAVDSGTGIACGCFGLAGGCTNGQICCKYGLKCTDLLGCGR